MQADTAVVERILTRVYPFSKLRGPANVLIFPDLNAANIAYKLLARLGDAQAIGPILVGMDRPVHVLQRLSEVPDIVNMAVIVSVCSRWNSRLSRSSQKHMLLLTSQRLHPHHTPSPQYATAPPRTSESVTTTQSLA